MPKAKQQPPSAPANRPVQEIRHRNIRATIWRNPTSKGPMYSVTLTRLYKDGEAWKDSHSFGFGDLMTASKALSDAHSVVSRLVARDRATAKGATPKETESVK